jgi:hypothetical protein
MVVPPERCVPEKSSDGLLAKWPSERFVNVSPADLA